MKARIEKFLAASIALSVAWSGPGLAVHEAAAQNAASAARSSAASGSGGVVVVPAVSRPVSAIGGAAAVVSPSLSAVLTRTAGPAAPAWRPGEAGLSAGRLESGSLRAAVPASALSVRPSPESGIEAPAGPLRSVAIGRHAVGPKAGAVAPVPGSAFKDASERALPARSVVAGALAEAVRSGSPAASVVPVSSRWRIGRLFDGSARRKNLGPEQGGAVEAASGLGGSAAGTGLAPAGARAGSSREDAPSPRRVPAGRSGSRAAVIAALAVAALTLALPAAALAATAAPATAAGIGILAAAHPLASALAAAVGAVYGLWSAHRGDKNPSAGEVLASVLRYGILAGAGVYVLLDLAQVLFLGLPAAGLKPLPSALATAALGQSAFQGKFADPATSPADRLMAAFPAVAAALGLSVGIWFAAPALLQTAAVGAMSVTGVAAALYAALFKPGKSAPQGPAAVARGYVLQSLMTGLALAVSSPYLAAPFALMAAWGFWDVLATVYKEAEAALPESVRRWWSR